MWARTPRSLTTPKMSSSIHFHICAATTVGIAHGTSMTARMTPRPLKLELTTSAMISPSTNSKKTVISVNLIVSPDGVAEERVVPAGRGSSSRPTHFVGSRPARNSWSVKLW